MSASVGVLTTFKRLLAHLIVRFDRFVHTIPGTLTLAAVGFSGLATLWYFEHIALIPFILRILYAGIRKLGLFILFVLLTTHARRWLRNQVKEVTKYLSRKWGALSRPKKIFFEILLFLVLASAVLDYFKVTRISLHIIMALPIPAFVGTFIFETLPAWCLGFAERQGLGRLVYDGGWRLLKILPPWLHKTVSYWVLHREEDIIRARRGMVRWSQERARRKKARLAAEGIKKNSKPSVPASPRTLPASD